MHRFNLVPVRVAILATSVAACGRDLPSGATTPDFAKASTTTSGITSVDVGASFAGFTSTAKGVNDAGDVAGSTCCGVGSGAYARVGGVARLLSGDGSAALAISNSGPLNVVGHVGSQWLPVLWNIDGPTVETLLPLIEGDTRGSALAVNDLGDVGGSSGNTAVIWSAVAGLTPIVTPEGFRSGEVRGLNNAGVAAIQFFPTSGSSYNGLRGYVRLATGELIELPPKAGDITTYANGISQVANGIVYVAGTTRADPYTWRSVRWTVDAATGEILATDMRPENSHALAPSNAGAIAGFIEDNAHTTSLTAYLWRGTSFTKLTPPRGGKDGEAWAISQSGGFIAGEAVFGTGRHAVLWKVN